MKTSIFSTSLTAFGLREAIEVAANVGYDAIELGCFAPHLTLDVARSRRRDVCRWLAHAGIAVSALSLTVEYTAYDDAVWRANVDETVEFVRACRDFGTDRVKTMPGRPGSAEAAAEHWNRYRRAMDIVAPVAASERVKLAVETHLNHLSDSIESCARCVEGYDPAVVGVNLDFCNVHTCRERALDAIDRFQGRIHLAHVKDSRFTTASGEYVPMGQGKMDYPPIIERLRSIGYEGYLSIECLYPQAKEHAPRAAAHDLAVLRELLGSSA